MYEKTHLTLGAVAVAAVVLALTTYALSILGGIIAISFTPFRDTLLSVTGHLRIVGFLVLVGPIFFVSNLLVFCYSFIAIFILCFWLGARNENGTLWGLKSIRQGARPVGLPNWLVVMPLVSSSLLLIVILFTFLLSFGGIPSGGLPIPQTPTERAREFAGIIYAPINEEVAFRITILGVLVGFRIIWNATKIPGSLIRKLLLAMKGFVFALYSPEKAKSILGLSRVASSGWRGIHWTEWTALALTSILFGLAHVLYGAGWEAGKIVTAGLSGFALGLVYLTYGAFANILLHWFFNFYLYVFTLDVYSGILSSFAITMDVIIFFLTLFLGALGIIVGIVWFRDRPRPIMRPTPYSTVTVSP